MEHKETLAVGGYPDTPLQAPVRAFEDTLSAFQVINDAALEAAMAHAKTVLVRPTVSDHITEEQWSDEGAQHWDITVGNLKQSD